MEDVDPQNQGGEKREKERKRMIGDKSHRVVAKQHCKCNSGLADRIEIRENQLPQHPSRREACA
jgi:hypothetical protein